MKILLLSLDSSILDSSSRAFRRMNEYAALVSSLHIFVFSRKIKKQSVTQKSAENLRISAFKANIFGVIGAFFSGRKLVNKREIDVVSAQDPFETGLLGFLIAKKKAGLQVQLHGDFYGNSYWRTERMLNRFRWHLGLYIMRRAKSIRVVSERIKNILNSNFFIHDSKMITVPIWIDLAYYRNSEPQFSLKQRYPQFNFLILAVANLVPVKNLEFLIRSMKKLHEILPQAGLIIVGDGPLRKNLESRIKNYGLEDIIILAGTQSDLVSYYKGADCFVLVSKYEGWGRVVIEAAASGLPLIMTDVGLAGEVIKNDESGIVLAGFKEDELARAFSQMHFNSQLRERLRQGAYEAIAKLPSKKETLDLIKESWEMVNSLTHSNLMV